MFRSRLSAVFRRARRWALVLTGVAGLAFGLMMLLGSTTSGSRWLLSSALPQVAPGLSVATVEGRLFGSLRLRELRFNQPALQVRMDWLRLDWRPQALLSGLLEVDRLEAEGVAISVPATDSAAPQSAPAVPVLPFRVRVAELTARRVSVETSADALQLAAVSLSAELDAERLRLFALSVVLDDDRLTGAISLATGPELTLEGRLQVHVARQTPALTLDLGVSGPLDRLHLRGLIGGPLDARFDLNLDVLTVPPRMQGQTTSGRIALAEALELRDAALSLDGSAERFAVSATGQLHADDSQSVAVQLDASVRQSEASGWQSDFSWQLAPQGGGQWPDIRGAGTCRYVDETLEFSAQTAAPLDARVDAELAGSGAAAVLNVRAQVENLLLPLTDTEQLQLVTANLEIKGALDDLALSAQARGHTERLGELELELEAAVTPEQMELKRSTLRLLAGEVATTGSIGWQPAPRVHLTIEGHGLDLRTVHADLNSDLAFSSRLYSPAGSEGLPLEFELQRLSGVWRDFPVEGTAHLSRVEDRLILHRAQMAIGGNRVVLSGALAPQLSGEFSAQLRDLAQLAPGLQGRLDASGHLSGGGPQAQLDLTLSGDELLFDSWRAHHISGALELYADSGRPARGRLEADSVVAAGTDLGRLAAVLEGTADDHELSVSVNGSEVVVNLDLAGRWRDSGWHGALTAADVAVAGETWSLHRPLAIDYAGGMLNSTAGCLVNGEARLCVDALSYDGVSGGADIRVQEFPLAAGRSYMPTTVNVDGTLQAEASLQLIAGELTGTGSLRLNAGEIHYRPEGRKAQRLPVEHLLAHFELDAGHLDLDIDARADKWLSLSARVGLGRQQPQPMRAEIDLKLESLEWLEEWVPDLAGSRGRATLTAHMGGELMRPRGEIRLSLDDAAVVSPRTGLVIDGLTLSVRSQGDGMVGLAGTISAVGDTLELSGDLALDSAAGWPGTLEFKSPKFPLLRLPQADVDISPQLSVAFSSSLITLSGVLEVPRAAISLRAFPEGAMAVSEDEVVIAPAGAGDGVSATRKGDNFIACCVTGNLDLRLGDEVHVSGMGMQAGLTGALNISKREDEFPGSARGRVSIRTGVYKAYGQSMKIERGHLIFSGPVDSPDLDVRAVRPGVDVVAGVLVSGNVRAPRFELFSEPAMPDSDVIAYIITGRALRDASSGEAGLIAGAALSLGAEQSSMVTGQLRDAFGLDDFSIGTGEAARETSLSAGKRLTPRLSVRSEFNPFDEIWALFVNYQLTDTWSVEAESGERQGADLIYSIERDTLWRD